MLQSLLLALILSLLVATSRPCLIFNKLLLKVEFVFVTEVGRSEERPSKGEEVFAVNLSSESSRNYCSPQKAISV